ncbi:hypothetical protein DTO166G4_7467 [Paecilomyces variotii]|nr:hypothetical protein DTO032I3_1657 [Paecilomyces variotii]KAJ9210970.1 hypothetical protein DTO166G4_7467 [Paecilomyces variotii]KAJ9242373.1 hypothetical protein DTO166G5_776 [Paecilomyces variotii]KAJ9278193.1 hypothetical protein DTO021D3_4927 [Paecilomyces variotii]KAJ9345557.1 hypothetical protein DTO027B6_2088 [Paecilomyces variotii]
MTTVAHHGQPPEVIKPPATTEVPEPLPNAAQIPLESFKLPAFPAQAAALQALTLTSDIKPTDYSDQLATALDPEAVPPTLPKSIEALTLELFSLGFPPPFLTTLGKALPKLKTLTLYSQLIDGVGDGSRKDAGEFFNDILTGKKENGGGLRELHLLDAFCRKGFMAGLGGILEQLNDPESQSKYGIRSAMRFLEVSYTYRGHADASFLDRIPADELPAMLVPSLLAASFSLAAPPERPEDSSSDLVDDPLYVDENGVPIPGRRPEGVVPFSPANAGTALLMRKLTGSEVDHEGLEIVKQDDRKEEEQQQKQGEDKEPKIHIPGTSPGPRNLKMLDSTLYTLNTEQLAHILRAQKELAILSASVIVSATEASKKALLDSLHGGQNGSVGKDLEVVEIVGVPDAEFSQAVSTDSTQANTDEVLKQIFPTQSDMSDLLAHLPRLETFKMTILRASSFGSVEWTRSPDGSWNGGLVQSKKETKDEGDKAAAKV